MKTLLTKFVPGPGTQAAKVLGWVVCVAVAALHAWTLGVAPYQTSTVIWVYPLLIAAPGLVSMLLLRGEWKNWYKWLTIVVLAHTSYAEFVPAIVFTGTVFSLHRAWVTERSIPLKTLLSIRRPTADAAPVNPSGKASGTSKTA